MCGLGEDHTYEHVRALRAVIGTAGMTGDSYHLDQALLVRTGTRITNEVKGGYRACHDAPTKPPGGD